MPRHEWTALHFRCAKAKVLVVAMIPEDPAEKLRRRIALYNEYLKSGVDAELAAVYLKTIAEDEAALARIEGGLPKQSR